MRHSEFVIGQSFNTGQRLWRCTDVGTRLVVAIRVDAADAVLVRICVPKTVASWGNPEKPGCIPFRRGHPLAARFNHVHEMILKR